MSDGTWMTYADLATLRGINHASAFKLALRRRWRRQKNNTGQMTVFVPSAWSDTSQDNAHDVSHQAEAFEAALAAVREAHAGETATLREQLAAANGRVDRAEAGREAERERADTLRDRLAAAEAAAEQARAQVEAARERADAAELAEAARRSAGVLARLRAAWRGE